MLGSVVTRVQGSLRGSGFGIFVLALALLDFLRLFRNVSTGRGGDWSSLCFGFVALDFLRLLDIVFGTLRFPLALSLLLCNFGSHSQSELNSYTASMMS